ncbi:MAG: bifunctional glycosyltransferase family 2/GtrA family protein [Lachnospiraceae bacterium]|nr:bifunctional glycosyltransferase family 2/GtrA family protein [Lachnospiraceae bacterium]
MGHQVIVIPSLKPDARLAGLVTDIREEFVRSGADAPEVVIVNDGSDASYDHFFEDAAANGATVLTHEVNRGKGAALKTAVRYIREHYGTEYGMITADADGQHLPKDILRVALDMEAHPEALVMGSREFGEGTPWKSLFGNRCTSFFFRITTGRSCRDTQTGLRGIPASLMQLAAEVEGDRYEYEMNFLMDAALVAPFHTTTIETVYFDDNKGSHFHPVRDAVRVYGRFLRFLLASTGGFLVDILMFMLFLRLFTASGVAAEGAIGGSDGPTALLFGMSLKWESIVIILSTVLARICSGIVNFLLNKHYAFRSKQKAAGEAGRYLVLFIGLMAASALFTSAISSITHLPTPTKIVVDVVLFLASYRIQRAWVFRKT